MIETIMIIGMSLIFGGVWMMPSAAGIAAIVAGTLIAMYGCTASGFKWLPEEEDKNNG